MNELDKQKALKEIEKELLDDLVASIPMYPPLKPGGDVTISEMYPDLTKEELDYVMSKYKGYMKI